MTKLPRYLLAGEPLRNYIPGLDTGVTLAGELLRRGIALDYCDLSEMDWKRDTTDYLSHLRVARIESAAQNTPAFSLGPWRQARVDEYGVILQRKDPPVDDNYRGHALHFTAAPRSIVQMNNPALTWKLSEHMLPAEYPEYSIPTFLCRDFHEFEGQIRSRKEDSVAKPMHLFSGVGIQFFSSQTSPEELQEYWEKWKPEIVVQPYLAEITTVGDLRILAINGKVVGSVLRKPKPGSRLANLHQGGSAHFFEPTREQLKAVDVISNDLCPRGLYLLGIDFIGNYVSEINITCPSALPQINEVSNIQGERIIIDELEKLRLLRV
jgi:glutathione synthase